MERRKALTVAGMASLVVMAGGAAFAANFGLLGVAQAGDSPQSLTAEPTHVEETTTTTTSDPQVVYVDEFVTVPAVPAPVAASATPTGDDEADDAPSAPAGTVPSPSTIVGSRSTEAAPVAAAHDSDDEFEHEDEAEHETEHADEVEHETEHELGDD